MKQLDLAFEISDEQYKILEEEAQTLGMGVEELMANAFSVILSDIKESVNERSR